MGLQEQGQQPPRTRVRPGAPGWHQGKQSSRRLLCGGNTSPFSTCCVRRVTRGLWEPAPVTRMSAEGKQGGRDCGRHLDIVTVRSHHVWDTPSSQTRSYQCVGGWSTEDTVFLFLTFSFSGREVGWRPAPRSQGGCASCGFGGIVPFKSQPTSDPLRGGGGGNIFNLVTIPTINSKFH